MRETGSGSRLALEQYCQQQHLTAQPFMEMGSIETVKQGVLAGLGVAVVPKLSVQTELNLGLMKIVPVKDFALRRSWCLVYPKGKHLSPAAQAFASFIQDNLAAINILGFQQGREVNVDADTRLDENALTDQILRFFNIARRKRHIGQWIALIDAGNRH